MGPSDEDDRMHNLRKGIIGLGEASHRKSYYPQLQKQIQELNTTMQALRESEEKYRTYVTVSPYPIFVMDLDGNFIDVNPASCKQTGYSREEMLQMNVTDLVLSERYEIYVRVFKQLHDEGKLSGEFPYRKKDGGVFYMELHAVRIPGDRFLVISMDITEKKKAEDEMLKAKIAAENANRTKSEFLANMSHELRTPLNSIIGFSDAMLDGISGEINDMQYKYLNNISQSGKHLLSIINEILDISRIESGQMRLYREEVFIMDLYNEFLFTFKHALEDKNIRLKTSVDHGAGCVFADRAKLTQIIYNLVSNAIKFTDNGGTVSIDTTIKGDHVHISVTDNGIGIDNEGLKKLFTPFTQLDSSESRKHEGTGLGLALSKELVELHSGTIWAESEPGKGSIFTFTLPLCR